VAQALALAIASSPAIAGAEIAISPDLPTLEEIETLIETQRHDEATTALDRVQPAWSGALARRITETPAGIGSSLEQSGRLGYLVFNPLNTPRRAAVLLPDAALDLRPEGPLKAAQFTDEGVWAVVELAPFGFAWVPKEADLGRPPSSEVGLSARGRRLSNESIAIEIDAATGGLRSVVAAGESTARIAQQLVLTGLFDSTGKPTKSQMRCEQSEVDYGGPALVQATSSGSLVDPQKGTRIASFTQRYRLWAGRPILELDITVTDLDIGWLERAAHADPWTVYLACRWAWPDPNSMLRRAASWCPELTEAPRPETPELLDISTRKQRTALLFGGLPYHRRHGNRMLDTLLIAGLESSRSFRLGVALDLEHPFHAASDLLAPALVVPIDHGPPALGTSGWLVQIDNKGVAVSHVEFASATGDGRGWGLIFHLLESVGQACRCRLRLFRNPSWARQVDFLSETVVELTIEGDAVNLDLTPHELARIEVTLG
jgi:alpha-mannosidase